MLNGKRAVVTDIVFMTASTGDVKPVIVLDDKGQVVLRNVHLLSYHAVLVGDTIEVDKFGEITSVIKCERPVDAHPTAIPDKCPSCNSALLTYPRKTSLKCTKSHSCRDQIIPRIVRYLDLMKAPLEQVTVKALYDKGLVRGIPDLYSLRGHHLVEVGMSMRDALDWMTMLDDPHAIEFSDHLYALGIPGMSKNAAKDVTSAHGDYDSLLKKMETRPTEMLQVHGSPGLLEYYESMHGREVLLEMRDILR